MASIVSFTPGTVSSTSALFNWTVDIEATDPQQQAYTLYITPIGHPTINVTFASNPYPLTGLSPGTSYDVELVLDYGGVQVSSAVLHIQTTGTKPPPTTSPRTLKTFTVTPGPGTVKFSYTLAGSDAYILTFLGGSNPVNVTALSQPITLGLSPNTTVTVTLSCLSDGHTSTLSQTIHTLPLPPVTVKIAAIPPNSRCIDALLPGSDIGSVHTRIVVGVFKSTNGTAFNLSRQNGNWNAPLALGGNYYFSPRGALVTQVLIDNDFNYQARTFGIALNLSIDNSMGPMQEVSNELIGFPVPPSLGGTFISEPAVASALPATVDVFGLGTDENLYHKHITETGTQANWAQVGTNFTGSPVAVVATPGLVELLAVRNGDLALLHATFNPTTNAVSAWTPTNGNVYANVSACSRTPGTLDVVVLGTDYAIYCNHFNGSSWGGWVSLGGKSQLYLRPSICSWSATRLDVCIVGTDNGYYHRWWDGTSWNSSGWESLGMTTLANEGLNPAMVVTTNGQLTLFAGDAHRNVITRDLTGTTWSPWITHMGASYF